MENTDLNNEILIKQTQINVEQDPNKKQELSQQLKLLQLRKEIDHVKTQMKKSSATK